jgi:hypothetical protein
MAKSTQSPSSSKALPDRKESKREGEREAKQERVNKNALHIDCPQYFIPMTLTPLRLFI